MAVATFLEADIRNRARTATSYRTAQTILSEDVRAQAQSPKGAYDVFLSHSFQDSELILGLKLKLEQDYRLSVYVDWVADPQLDRTKVDAATARTLRERMNRCKVLFYAATTSSTQSKWMPWECGYFDGKFARAAILPLTSTPQRDYRGQEYLGVYPYILEDVVMVQGRPQKVLLVQSSPKTYCTLYEWLNDKQPIYHQ